MMFVGFVIVLIKALYLFITFICMCLILTQFFLFVLACFTLATLGYKEQGQCPTGTDAPLMTS